MKVSNKEIAKVLEISPKTVYNKLNGDTDWTLTEYQLLVKHFGYDVANNIVNLNMTKEEN